MQDRTYCEGYIRGWRSAFSTADHGNAEQMVNHETGKPHTAHTTNVVPLILVGAQNIHKQLKSGKLCDIAPTMLALAHIDKPSDMTGESLLID